jgi:uncharacterized membrane protein YdjX (TVP38/TMEM64 family)
MQGLLGFGPPSQSASRLGKDVPYTPDSKALRSKEHSSMPWWSGKKAQALGMAAAVLGLVFLFTRFLQGGISVTGFLIGMLDWARALGVWSVPVLIGCEMLAFLLLLPISPLHIGIGFLYGPWAGALIAWGAYCAGCVLPFLLARLPILAERFKQMRRRADLLDGVFSAVESEPFKLIVCLRLSPMLPSTLNSYLLGLTNVPFWTYFAGSCVGSLPNVCAYVYLGTMLDSLADIAAGRVKRSPLSWLLMGTGLVATVAALAYVSRAATRRVQNARSKHAASSPCSGGLGGGGGGGSGSGGGDGGGGGNRGWRSSAPDGEHTALLAGCSGSEHAV